MNGIEGQFLTALKEIAANLDKVTAALVAIQAAQQVPEMPKKPKIEKDYK